MFWNVFYYDFNKREISTYNIFNHSSFREEFEKIKLIKDKESFAKELHLLIRYYFWSRCEWEVVICGWPNTEIKEKIDVYSQLQLNWDIFLDYCWKEKNN